MQQKEMDTEDDVAFECSNYDEDDILYSCPHNSEDYEPCFLLFIHQSFDQLEIMKRQNILSYNIQVLRFRVKIKQRGLNIPCTTN